MSASLYAPNAPKELWLPEADPDIEDLTSQVRLRKNENDGSTDLWFGGWRIHFYSNTTYKPKAEKGEPDGGAQPPTDGDKVKAWADPEYTYVSYGDWSAIFPADRAKPPILQHEEPIGAGLNDVGLVIQEFPPRGG